MAIVVKRGPSMIDYGYAVALAAERMAANERSLQYSEYLQKSQQANRSFALDLSNLGLQQQRQALDVVSEANRSKLGLWAVQQGDEQNLLNRDKLRADLEMAKFTNQFNAQQLANQNLNSYAALSRALGS